MVMEGIRIMALLTLLNAGHLAAGDFTETNKIPEPIHSLMDKAGYGLGPKELCGPSPVTNSIRNLPLTGKVGPLPRVLPNQKTGWSFWNGTSIKYLGRNPDTVNAAAPAALSKYLSPSQFEYSITYSFGF